LNFRAEFAGLVTNLLGASYADRQEAADALRSTIGEFLLSPDESEVPSLQPAPVRDAPVLEDFGARLASFGDADLNRFNELLPWGAMTAAPNGRVVGRAWSPKKRNVLNSICDARITAFNARLPLAGRHVLEAGCFEGIHTIACAVLGARVTGFDGRMENILKTMARVWAYQQSCELFLWNIEKEPSPELPKEWDVLMHVGVLYHLLNPVEHLSFMLPRTRDGLLLDTHVTFDDADANQRMTVDGIEYRYAEHDERHSATSPFAGLGDHAKWLHLDDLLGLIRRRGFPIVEVVSDRSERNGRRVTIHAFRTPPG